MFPKLSVNETLGEDRRNLIFQWAQYVFAFLLPYVHINHKDTCQNIFPHSLVISLAIWDSGWTMPEFTTIRKYFDPSLLSSPLLSPLLSPFLSTVPDVRARRLPRLLGMVPGVAGVVGLQLLPLFFTTVWRETDNRLSVLPTFASSTSRTCLKPSPQLMRGIWLGNKHFRV